MHMCVFICADVSSEDLTCVYQNTLNHPSRKMSHMHISTRNENYASMGWDIAFCIPPTRPNVAIHSMYEYAGEYTFVHPRHPPQYQMTAVCTMQVRD